MGVTLLRVFTGSLTAAGSSSALALSGIAQVLRHVHVTIQSVCRLAAAWGSGDRF